MNSRQKGARGERMWRDVLKAAGFHARRGQQFSGSPDSPDVVSESLELKPFHFEVKSTETFNAYNAMEQAVRDDPEKVPVVAHKRNHREWLVVMRAEDWLKMVKGEV